jgi:hypothetical protein
LVGSERSHSIFNDNRSEISAIIAIVKLLLFTPADLWRMGLLPMKTSCLIYTYERAEKREYARELMSIGIGTQYSSLGRLFGPRLLDWLGG